MNLDGSREEHLVELVTPGGVPVGAATVAEAHAAPGRLHRAFSVLLRDPDGRILLQRRAATKSRFALRWANTCCGHPAPGVPVESAAVRRLGEELGVRDVTLTDVGIFVYRAADPASGLVEHEFDHVLVGDALPGSTINPDPAEVVDVAWVTEADLSDALAATPDRYAPWLPGVLDHVRAHPMWR
jgi:isopentenyl-diphosphate Delta-isomerase